MSEIITFQDGTPLGTFSQIKLGDEERVLISLTQTEVAIFKLSAQGIQPVEELFKHDVFHFIRQAERKGAYFHPDKQTLLQYLVKLLLPCKSVDQVIIALDKIIR